MSSDDEGVMLAVDFDSILRSASRDGFGPIREADIGDCCMIDDDDVVI
jgi:hypothetical protein